MSDTLTTDQLTAAAERLAPTELDDLLRRLTLLRARLRSPQMSDQESNLLERISALVPTRAIQERRALSAIQQTRPFTESELERFSELTDEIETADAQRLEIISQWAALRGFTLRDAIRQLGLQSR